ncbi:General stress protein 13 [Streptococcus gordonii]|uniref:General stress protein 13 n=1 Tax=Streptococcus gordonii TaxID=1302 RepID=A0A139N7K8_STRGN|nr:General stress protein 13 [Streptococcus gordonii]
MQVQVLDFDEYTKKASLSMRTLEEEKHRLPKRHRFSNDRHKFGFAPLAKSIPTWTEEALQFLSNQKDEKENHPEC